MEIVYLCFSQIPLSTAGYAPSRIVEGVDRFHDDQVQDTAPFPQRSTSSDLKTNMSDLLSRLLPL